MPPAVALTAWCCPCVALGNLAALRKYFLVELQLKGIDIFRR